jgi:hypothetical protein
MNSLTSLQEGYVYVLASLCAHARDVWIKKKEGWEVVQGDMPEARELVKHGHGDSDTVRQIGDAILMRMQEERYVKYRATQRVFAKQREGVITARMRETAAKSDGKIIIHTDPTQRNMERGGTLWDVMQQRAPGGRTAPGSSNPLIVQQATSAVDQMIRDGRVPGMNAPGDTHGLSVADVIGKK